MRVLIIVFAVGVFTVQAATPDHDSLRRELLEMQEKDQVARIARDSVAMRAVDQVNTSRLKEIVRSHGWPTYSMVGEDGAMAAWLIAQHADADPAFQHSVLALMEPLVAKREANGSNFAYLFDRTHRPQRFGTQGSCTGPGTWKPREIEDPEKVDERRAAAGITPLKIADYAKVVGSMCK